MLVLAIPHGHAVLLTPWLGLGLQAYTALYRAGLLDDHLLPVSQALEDEKSYATVEKRPNLIATSDQMDVFRPIAELWREEAAIHESVITIWFGNNVQAQIIIQLPRRLPDIAPFQIFWDGDITLNVTIDPSSRSRPGMSKVLACQSTHLMFRSVFQSRMPDSLDFAALFVPFDVPDLSAWIDSKSGRVEAHKVCHADTRSVGLIRDLPHNRLFVFEDVKYVSREDVCSEDAMEIDQSPQLHEFSDDVDGERCIVLEVKRMSKRADYLHKVHANNPASAARSGIKFLLADNCVVDNLPYNYAQFALLVPSILHKIQVQ